MARTIKGVQCKKCFKCKTRTFRDHDKLSQWLLERKTKMALEPGFPAIEVGLQVYWCAEDTPIQPQMTPPWWKARKDMLGCPEVST